MNMHIVPKQEINEATSCAERDIPTRPTPKIKHIVTHTRAHTHTDTRAHMHKKQTLVA